MLVILLIGLAPIVLAVVGAAVVQAIDRYREVRRHSAIVSDLGMPVAAAVAFGSARGKVVTVEGRLVADKGNADASLVSFHPYGTSFLDEVNIYAITHSSAGAGFAVELDHNAGRVVLDGPIQVLRGAFETEHTAPLDKANVLGAEPLGRAKMKVKKRVGQFRIVTTGDRVRARGAIEPAPDDDALYRARSNVLRMTPEAEDSGDPKIPIAATTTRRRAIQSRRGVIPTLVASAAVGGALAAVAARADRIHHTEQSKSATVVGSSSNEEPPCRAPVLAKLARYEVTDPGSATQGCDDAYARALASYAAGDFSAASKAFTEVTHQNPNLTPTLAEVETHLFVHSFGEAAAVVRRMNAQFYPGPSTAEKRHLECITDVLEGRAKRAASGNDGGPRFVKVCATRPFAKLARQLDSDGTYRGEDDWPRPTFTQETRYDAVNLPYTAVVATRARLMARPVALERDLLDRLLLKGGYEGTGFGLLDRYFEYEADALYPVLTTWAAELTLFYAYAGFPERSKPYWPILDRVAELLEANRSFHHAMPGASSESEKKKLEDEHVLLNHVMSVAGAAAFYSDDEARMKRYTGLGEPYSSQATRQMSRVVQASSPWEDPVVDRAWPEHKAVFDAAEAGSAAEVARVLSEQHSTGRTTLPRVVPRLARASNRSALDLWFHESAYPPACLTCGASTYLGDISDRREVARLLGDTRERDRLRTVAERFTTALTDPELGFELDELEMFFSKKH